MDSLTRRFLAGLAAVWLSLATALAGLPVRVAVIGPDAAEATALITSGLAKLDGIDLVPESEIAKLPAKQTTVSNNADRMALGQALTANLLILVDPKGDAFAYVDGFTGEELFRIRQDTSEELANSAYVLVEELRNAEKAPKVIVAETKGTEAAAAQLRNWLENHGVTVLTHVTLDGGSDPATLGADLLLKVKSAGGKYAADAVGKDGKPRGTSPSWKGDEVPEAMGKFLEPLLAPAEGPKKQP